MENIENKDHIVGEAELEGVSGGRGVGEGPTSCNFIHKSGGMETKDFIAMDGSTVVRAICAASWFKCSKDACICHGTNNCIHGYHIITDKGSPLPRAQHENWYN